MKVLARLFQLGLCVLVLFAPLPRSHEPEARAVPRDIRWKEVTQKIRELEDKRKLTFDALTKKSQARTTPKPTR